MLSPSNRCVTASGIIFHSASSSHQWPFTWMEWPLTPPSSTTTEPSRTPPRVSACSSVPAGVRLTCCAFHLSSKKSFASCLKAASSSLNPRFRFSIPEMSFKLNISRDSRMQFLASYESSWGISRQASETFHTAPFLPFISLSYNSLDASCLWGLII